MGDSTFKKLTNDQLKCSPKERFVIELEFVQCLANPQYLNWLGQNGHFNDPAFINFLRYLLYWKRPEYAKYLTYPHTLFFLDLVQDKSFREHIKDPRFATLAHDQQFYFWQHFRANRVKEVFAALEQPTDGAAAPSPALPSAQ